MVYNWYDLVPCFKDLPVAVQANSVATNYSNGDKHDGNPSKSLPDANPSELPGGTNTEISDGAIEDDDEVFEYEDKVPDYTDSFSIPQFVMEGIDGKRRTQSLSSLPKDDPRSPRKVSLDKFFYLHLGKL